MSKFHFTYCKQRNAKKEQMMFSQMKVTVRKDRRGLSLTLSRREEMRFWQY